MFQTATAPQPDAGTIATATACPIRVVSAEDHPITLRGPHRLIDVLAGADDSERRRRAVMRGGVRGRLALHGFASTHGLEAAPTPGAVTS